MSVSSRIRPKRCRFLLPVNRKAVVLTHQGELNPVSQRQPLFRVSLGLSFVQQNHDAIVAKAGVWFLRKLSTAEEWGYSGVGIVGVDE